MGLFRSSKTPAEIWRKWDGVRGMPATVRKARAIGGNLTIISIDRERCRGEYAGSEKKNYKTSLLKCSCPDFSKRSVPCKHMYNLAFNLGLSIQLDYMEMMRGALDNPGYHDADDSRLKDFWAYRNTFEMMFGNKIIGIVQNEGGRISQVDLKDRLNNGELQYYDYVISMLTETNRLKRWKEKGRVMFSV